MWPVHSQDLIFDRSIPSLRKEQLDVKSEWGNKQ